MDTSFYGFIKEVNGPFSEAPHKGYWVANDIKPEDNCIHLEQRLKRYRGRGGGRGRGTG